MLTTLPFAIQEAPLMVFCTVMLVLLSAVTVPIKSPMVSKAPEGVPTRGVVVAVKAFACVKSTATVAAVGVVMALLRLTSRPIHEVWPPLRVSFIGMLTVVAAAPESGQTAPTPHAVFISDKEAYTKTPLEAAKVTL